MSDARYKVLVVEDNREHLMALRIKLAALGYDVVYASDGMTATMMANKEQPDAIMLDLGLPAGDGFVVLKRLRDSAMTATIPVIVVTARPPAGNYALSMKQGATAFLQKPVQTEQIRTVLSKALSGSSSAL